MIIFRAVIVALIAQLAFRAALAVERGPPGPLPRPVTPMAYRLDLSIDPARPTFSGRVEIAVRLTRGVRSFFLDAKDLHVSRARISVGNRVYTLEVSATDVSGVERIGIPRELAAGAATVSFDYTGAFQSIPQGLFHGKVGGDWYAWSEFEPDNARLMFPCFDDPQFKTPFTVTIKTPAGARAFSNAPEVTSTAAGGWTIHHFVTTEPLPTYLVAVAVGPFESAETVIPPNSVRSRPLPLRIIAVRGRVSRMQTALTNGPRLLGLLESYLGVPYPFAKLDYLTSPVFHGGVEDAGLILFGDSILLQPGLPPQGLQGFGGLVAHEMAHQWFGDLVTPRWWNDLWLNESFATWLGAKIADEWSPDPATVTETLAGVISAMDLDSLSAGRSVRQPIRTTRQIASAIDAITYFKGAQVLGMFEQFVGSRAFAAGLRRYLESHPYGSVSPEDLYRGLDQATGNPEIGAAIRTFIDQPGVPVVTVREEPHGILLRQARYRPLGAASASPALWMIPLCLTRDGHRSCTLLKTTSATIVPMPGRGALLPNAEGRGYYRFDLADSAWDDLIARAASLPGPAALVMADSLWAQFAAGKIDFARVVAAARALSDNPVGLAEVSMGLHLSELAHTVLSPGEMPQYRKLMRSIYASRLAAIGLNIDGRRKGEAPGVGELRQMLLPLAVFEGRDAPTRARLAKAAERYVTGDKEALDPSLVATALGVAVQEGGQPFMKRLEELLAGTPDPSLRESLVTALGAADTPELARAALRFAGSLGFNWPEREHIVEALERRPATRAIATAYARRRFDQMVKVTPDFGRPGLVELFKGYCDVGHGAAIDSFLKPRLGSLDGADLALSRLEDRIVECVALKRVKGAQVAAELARYD